MWTIQTKSRLSISICTSSMPAYAGNNSGSGLNSRIRNSFPSIIPDFLFPPSHEVIQSSNIFVRLHGGSLFLLVVLPWFLFKYKTTTIYASKWPCIIKPILGRMKWKKAGARAESKAIRKTVIKGYKIWHLFDIWHLYILT